MFVCSLCEKCNVGSQDILATTSDYPESLAKTIEAIKEMVPVEVPLPSFDDIFASQEATSTKMAEELEALAHHYDNMSNALHDFEAGEEFGEEDMHGKMSPCTEEMDDHTPHYAI